MKRICTICARGGSKGVPVKNLAPVLGRPLIAHTIVQAQESAMFDAIAVSSDSAAILQAAEEYGVELLIRRPDALATDNSAKLPVVKHCVEAAEQKTGMAFDIMVDMDVTSPLRLRKDITGAVALLEDGGCSNVITGAVSRRSPYFNLVERGSDDFVHLSKPLEQAVTRRQDAPRCFDMNASIYVWKRESFFPEPKVFYEDTKLFEMPDDRSLDIDNPLDLEIVSFLMARRMGLETGVVDVTKED
ncbi:cytidylyltransferase domain-containing protein [Aestuariispira insulae]|uniref:N-acylneuraminate cytidylyltransferase/CMP-N,N'-diacetyllegionaminic acid synthase n=1 Tax=Aestuariispira insulae TaxID=1461337 RepID=A0A3D9HXK2_9PROT|nr:acylneuraminate cytidylyltransferase family protein [Aestuariispira insulae]RED54101.1 N-acylneuraminate cytidylyltransferase/CMP-N,N'-diacetyllegionaminic acid synthase [Aestuariispira insulae]